jgi:hypothetical protein
MPFCSAYFAAGLALISLADAAEDGNATVSPIRQFLRESITAQLPTKPADPGPAKPETKPADAPVQLPAFRVNERPFVQVFDQVNAALAQEDRLRTHPLFKTNRLDILHKPTLEPGPAGTQRFRLEILQLR